MIFWSNLMKNINQKKKSLSNTQFHITQKEQGKTPLTHFLIKITVALELVRKVLKNYNDILAVVYQDDDDFSSSIVSNGSKEGTSKENLSREGDRSRSSSTNTRPASHFKEYAISSKNFKLIILI